MEYYKYVKKKETNLKQTPHNSYHWHGDRSQSATLSDQALLAAFSDRNRFFEGWYFRITLPKIRESFAFMYSIDDPCGGKTYSGGAAQIIGINEEYLWRTFPDVHKFYADTKSLALTHWGNTSLQIQPQILKPNIFKEKIRQGYQVTDTLNQGFIKNPSNNKYCYWEYNIKPIYGWGDINKTQKSTGGLLSFLPIFEPGWQVLMAHGLATGYVDWNGEIYQFKDAPAYAEKNWGRSFPQKWFWVNCNSFDNQPDLALTAAGGKRKVLWWTEEVAMIGIHYQGKFYEFLSWNCQMSWQVDSWGKWEMEASNNQYKVKLIGTTNLSPTQVRVPTEKGLIFNCQDTLKGKLKLELSYCNGQNIFTTESDVCGLEIGG